MWNTEQEDTIGVEDLEVLHHEDPEFEKYFEGFKKAKKDKMEKILGC